MTDYSRLAAQYGQHYADALEAHTNASLVIREFADQHPLTIPDPDIIQPEDGPRFTILNPVKHTLYRDGDFLGCRECGVKVHAPSPPRRPLTPQEASLSPFD